MLFFDGRNIGPYNICESLLHFAISAQKNGSLQWNRDSAKGWEQFTVNTVNGKYTFRSSHNKFISAQPKGGLEVKNSLSSFNTTIV